MVKYYYDKFTAIGDTKWIEGPWVLINDDYEHVFHKDAKTYSFDQNTGRFTPGSSVWDYYAPVDVGDVAYFVSGSELWRWTATKSVSQSWGNTNVQFHKKNPVEQTTYSKGSLVQANIVAEDGTYPINGRHNDGYWYVKGSIVNTAPTTPGAFTQPSGALEIGDSKVFAVGASSDAEGNLSKYIWEASINGGAYSKVGETTTPSLNYTIPTATSLKMRVKAIDTTNLESTYRESSLYTVQPPQYYYDKFAAIKNETYGYRESVAIPGTEIGINNVAVTNQLNPLLRENFGDGTVINPTIAYSEVSIDNMGKFVMTKLMDRKLDEWVFKYIFENSITVGPYGNRRFYMQVTGPGAGTYMVNMFEDWEEQNPGHFYTVTVYKLTPYVITTTYSKGALIQTGVIGSAAAYPTDGRHTDGFWYVRKSRVNQSIAPPSPFTTPASGKIFKPSEVATIAFGASNAANLSLYEVDCRYNSTGTWTPLPYNNTLSRSLTITTNKTLKTLELRVRAKDTSNVYSDYVYSEPFEIEHNVAPTVSLTWPDDNTTLYENDDFKIAGTAYDADSDQSVTVYYQINSEPRKVLATNLSQLQIALSKQLKFKSGKIYDGETNVTGNLAAGVAHKLKVWAVDSENAQSKEVERTFYVIPNRAPLLSVDAVVPSGVVDADKFKISGTVSDEDANSNVKVTRKINGGNPVEIYSGQGGAWEFEIALSQLVIGENTIVVEVIDNYGAKTSKTIKLRKNEVKTSILHSVARYKIKPPTGSAKGVLLFIERDEAMDLKVELSMTVTGEQEQYETLTPDNTAPMPNTVGVVEDTYFHETTEPKDSIILKLSTTRPDATVNHKIHLISGAVE